LSSSTRLAPLFRPVNVKMKSARALLPLELEPPEELLAPLEELLPLLAPLLEDPEDELADEPLELLVPPDENEEPPPQAARQTTTDRQSQRNARAG
jgi:hypothetical protein